MDGRVFKSSASAVSGVADAYAYAWANRLVSNPFNSAALEICLGNFSARFSEACDIAITGAKCKVKRNGHELPMWAKLTLSAGDTLSISMPTAGIYNYLAIAGNLAISPVLGSAATSLRDGIGPNSGKTLESGQDISYLPAPAKPNTAGVQTHWACIPDYNQSLTARVLACNQFSDFSPSSREAFFSLESEIATTSNKMGARLIGPGLDYQGSELYSEGVVAGSIQVTSARQAIVLLADHQSIGGYPNLGTFFTLTSDKLRSAAPGQKIKFQLATLTEAQTSLNKFNDFFDVKPLTPLIPY